MQNNDIKMYAARTVFRFFDGIFLKLLTAFFVL